MRIVPGQFQEYANDKINIFSIMLRILVFLNEILFAKHYVMKVKNKNLSQITQVSLFLNR